MYLLVKLLVKCNLITFTINHFDTNKIYLFYLFNLTTPNTIRSLWLLEFFLEITLLTFDINMNRVPLEWSVRKSNADYRWFEAHKLSAFPSNPVATY